MAKLKPFLVLPLVLLIAACGWQLRGAAGGGFADVSIALEGEVGNRVLQEIAAELRRLDAEVVTMATDADWVLRVSSAGSDRRTVATDNRGFASDYELRYRMTFSLSPGGRADTDTVGTERQTVQASASYSANTDNLQAQEAEEALLERELRDDAIRLLLARIGRRL